MLVIAASELARMLRSSPGLVSGVVAPIALSSFLIWRHEVFAGTGHGYVAAVVVVVVSGFAVHASTVSALPADGHDVWSERGRSSAQANASFVGATALPAAAMATFSLASALLVLAASTGSPGAPGTFAGATFLMLSMMIALGMATAGVIRGPELAPVATLLVVVGVIGVAHWVGMTGTDDLTALKRILPGGAAAELAMTSWDGTVVAVDVPLMVGPTLGWVLASALVASRCFDRRPRPCPSDGW